MFRCVLTIIIQIRNNNDKKKTSDTGLPIALGLVIAKYALEGPWQGREEDNLVTRPRTQGSRVKRPKEYLV